MPLLRRPATLVALSMLLVAGCRPSAPPTVRIGVLATLTGRFGEVSGRPTVEGARLAVRDFGPLELGDRPVHVELTERDFADRADAAARAARALINQDSVVAIVGPQFSRHAIPVAIIADDAHVPMISPMSSNAEVTRGRSYVFRLATLDEVMGAALARYAARELTARRAAVLFDVSAVYSRGLAERFRATFDSAGGRVVAFETYTADRADDIAGQVRRIAAARPDVVFLPNFSDVVVRQVPALWAAGVRAVLLGSDSWDPQTVPLADGQRAVVAGQWRPDLPTEPARRFAAAYRAAYGAAPRAAAAMTYDAVTLLLGAMRSTGSTDPDSLRAAIARTVDFEGASGTIRFAGRSDPVRPVAISAVRNQGLETLALIAP